MLLIRGAQKGKIHEGRVFRRFRVHIQNIQEWGCPDQPRGAAGRHVAREARLGFQGGNRGVVVRGTTAIHGEIDRELQERQRKARETPSEKPGLNFFLDF